MPYRLTYVSTISGSAAAVLPSTVEDILIQSVINNAGDGITGFLLADGVAFVQVLEGAERLVEACFARILLDPRHELVTVRERLEVEARQFPLWSMCGLTLSPADDALLTTPDIAFDLRSAATGALVQLLGGLADRHGAELDAQHARLLRGGPL